METLVIELHKASTFFQAYFCFNVFKVENEANLIHVVHRTFLGTLVATRAHCTVICQRRLLLALPQVVTITLKVDVIPPPVVLLCLRTPPSLMTTLLRGEVASPLPGLSKLNNATTASLSPSKSILSLLPSASSAAATPLLDDNVVSG
jgi:hypothetical protein